MRAATFVCALVQAGAFWVVTSGLVSAQPPAPRVDRTSSELRFTVHAAGLVGVPLGAFADNVDTSGGADAEFSVRVGNTPFRVGGGIGFLSIDSATRQVPLSLTIPEVLVDVTTSNNLLMTHARLRLQPVTGAIRPYADALIGLNYIYTRTAVKGIDSGVAVASTTNVSDLGLAVGGGLGVMVDIVTWSDGRFGLDVGAEYRYGGESDYLVAGEQGLAAGVTELDARRSRTDLFLVRLGGSLEF